MATLTRPPIITRLPPKRSVASTFDPPNLLATTLNGKDALPFRQTDWPNPLKATYGQVRWPIDLRKWTASYPLMLIGQDKLPFRQLDWPNPHKATYGQVRWPIDLRKWTWSFPLGLIGKDAFPSGRLLDQPNPIRKKWS